MSHFKVLCRLCGILISQCRCASEDKEIQYEICAKCKENHAYVPTPHPDIIPEGSIDITGLPKGRVLAALYNGSHVQGMGFMQAKPGIMTPDEGEELLKKTTYFDYLYGKVMKVDLSKDSFNPFLYDRDNFPGAALQIIRGLRTAH